MFIQTYFIQAAGQRQNGSVNVTSRVVRICFEVLLSLLIGILGVGLAAAQCVSITSYGGNGNGTTNNSPALASAFAALLTTNGGCISFPGGKCLFSTAVTLSFPAISPFSLTLAGAGADNTILYFPSTPGISIKALGAVQSSHIRDVTFSTGSTGQVGLTLQNTQGTGADYGSDISRTTFRGDDAGGTGTDYWGTGVNIAGQSNVNWDTVNFFGNTSATPFGAPTYGIGIALNGVPTDMNSPYSVIYNVAKCGFYWVGTGIVIGTYVQGIAITQTNFTNGVTGIYAEPNTPSSLFTLNELSVTGGNQFGVTGNSIIIDQNLYNFIVNGNLFNVYESNSGIFFDFTGQNNTIVNNIFVADPSSTGGKGIYVGASTPNGVVSGNVFQSLDTGVYLGGTSGWNVQANSYLAVTHTVSGIGSNKVGVATQ
jgi:hypothetical protein